MAKLPSEIEADNVRLRKRNDWLEDTIEERDQEVATLKIKLHVAATLVTFMNEAYDAQRFCGVDFRACRVYLEPGNPLLDDKTKMTEKQAVKTLTLWLGRMTNDLRAAVKRKAMREVPKGNP